MNNYPENYKIPDLRSAAEPVYALKDATGAFMDFIARSIPRPRPLVIYNGSTAKRR
jgi:hypothetical protein